LYYNRNLTFILLM